MQLLKLFVCLVFAVFTLRSPYFQRHSPLSPSISADLTKHFHRLNDNLSVDPRVVC